MIVAGDAIQNSIGTGLGLSTLMVSNPVKRINHCFTYSINEARRYLRELSDRLCCASKVKAL
jgi:hypothetical protein